MCHYRDKIESCVKDILWDQTMAKQRVFTVSEAVYNQNYPMIILFSPKETVETPPLPMRPFRRLNLDIVGIIRGQKDLVTQSHLFAREIEEAIAMETDVFPSFVQQVNLLQSEVEIQSNNQPATAEPAPPVDRRECLLSYVKICYAIEYRAGTTTFNLGDPTISGATTKRT